MLGFPPTRVAPLCRGQRRLCVHDLGGRLAGAIIFLVSECMQCQVEGSVLPILGLFQLVFLWPLQLR